MFPQVIAVLAIAIFAIILLKLFLVPLLMIIVNAFIVFVVAVRMFSELKKKNVLENYMIAAVISLVLFLIIGNPISVLWPITTFLILVLLLAPASPFMKKQFKKLKKKI